MNQEARGLYDKVVNLIKSEMFLEENKILKGNSEESVTARSVLVSILAKYLTQTEIANLTNLKKCSISRILGKCIQCQKTWSCQKTKDKISRIIEKDYM